MLKKQPAPQLVSSVKPKTKKTELSHSYIKRKEKIYASIQHKKNLEDGSIDYLRNFHNMSLNER